MSKAVDSPVTPCSRRYLKRLLVSSGVPNPANCRMVQSRPRYIVGCGPRVYGNCPGNPLSRRYFSTSCSDGSPTSAGVSRSGIGMPESVLNACCRSGAFSVARARSTFRHCSCACLSLSLGVITAEDIPHHLIMPDPLPEKERLERHQRDTGRREPPEPLPPDQPRDPANQRHVRRLVADH